jgi:phosphoglycerate dehydrogenase-like enzyme
VFKDEPPDSVNTLLTMETGIPTAHCLSWTDSFVEDVARDAISGIIAVLSGHWPEFVVNPAAKAHARVQTWMGGV